MSGRSEAMRVIGDAPADRVVRELHERGAIPAANTALRTMIRNDDPLPRDTPPVLQRFLVRTSALPKWADRDALLRAQAFADRNAVGIAIALFCGALPTSFAGAKGAAVLAASGRMFDDIDRRINETGRFVFDVITPGGLDPRGFGIRSVQKVRLVHAAVRHHIASHGRGSEVAINQEDLLGTLFSFSLVVLSSLRRLGVVVASSDAEAFYHLWRVVGAMLGIRPALLPKRIADARTVADAIAQRQFKRSPHGIELTGALLAGIERHVTSAAFSTEPASLVEYLIGQKLAALLGVGDRGVRACPLSPPLDGLLALARRDDRGRGRDLLERMVTFNLAGERPTFAMPTTLRQRKP